MIHLKVFCCLTFARNLQSHRTKFQPRARKIVFVGYKEGTKGYVLYDLQSHEIFISRNIILYENVFSFIVTIPPTTWYFSKSTSFTFQYFHSNCITTYSCCYCPYFSYGKWSHFKSFHLNQSLTTKKRLFCGGFYFNLWGFLPFVN